MSLALDFKIVLKEVVKATTAFVAVNIDEFVVLIAFFAKVDHVNMKNIHVIAGQLIGFTIIFLISASGIIFGQFIDFKILSLIGFVPLLMGLFDLNEVIKYWCKQCCLKPRIKANTLEEPLIAEEDIEILYHDKSRHENESNPSSSQVDSQPNGFQIDTLRNNNPSSSNEQSKLVPSASSSSSKSSASSSSTSSSCSSSSSSNSSNNENNLLTVTCNNVLSHILDTNTLLVCLTIIADGAEEIGIFLPLLATADRLGLLIIVITFYILIILQCFLAYSLIRCKYIGSFISRYSKNIVPFVLLGLGLYILNDSILADVLHIKI